jgi:anti-sigma28 factor (negative regulator of flagellin synthesis)
VKYQRSSTTHAQRAALRRRIRTGRYRIDPANVAAAMLARAS